MLLCSIQASSLSKGCTQDYSRWRQNLTEIVVLKHVCVILTYVVGIADPRFSFFQVGKIFKVLSGVRSQDVDGRLLMKDIMVLFTIPERRIWRGMRN